MKRHYLDKLTTASRLPKSKTHFFADQESAKDQELDALIEDLEKQIEETTSALQEIQKTTENGVNYAKELVKVSEGPIASYLVYGHRIGHFSKENENKLINFYLRNRKQYHRFYSQNTLSASLWRHYYLVGKVLYGRRLYAAKSKVGNVLIGAWEFLKTVVDNVAVRVAGVFGVFGIVTKALSTLAAIKGLTIAQLAILAPGIVIPAILSALAISVVIILLPAIMRYLEDKLIYQYLAEIVEDRGQTKTMEWINKIVLVFNQLYQVLSSSDVTQRLQQIGSAVHEARRTKNIEKANAAIQDAIRYLHTQIKEVTGLDIGDKENLITNVNAVLNNVKQGKLNENMSLDRKVIIRLDSSNYEFNLQFAGGEISFPLLEKVKKIGDKSIYDMDTDTQIEILTFFRAMLCGELIQFNIGNVPIIFNLRLLNQAISEYRNNEIEQIDERFAAKISSLRTQEQQE